MNFPSRYLAVGAAVNNTQYVEVPASYRLVGATVTQEGASVTAHAANYKILTLKDSSGNTIATANTVAGKRRSHSVYYVRS